jgi:hypothetical protein
MSKSNLDNDRNNMIRIQYSTHDKVPSSLTVDPTLHELLNRELDGAAKKWIQVQAADMRQQLLMKAEKLKEEGRLYKFDSNGNRKEITKDEFVRGKVSASVRKQALLVIAKPSLLGN